jgi:hypothetical protein
MFHKHCLLLRDNKYHCPHCAAESTQEEKRVVDQGYTASAKPSFVVRKDTAKAGNE